jgi:hypothetical protein
MKQAPMSYSEFWQRFTRAERNGKAFKVRVLGMQAYPLLRTKLYYRIAQQVGLFDAPHPHPEASGTRGYPVWSLTAVPRAKVVVVPFSRQVQGSDPYSDRVIEALSEAGVSHWVLRHNDPDAEIDTDRLRDTFDIWYEANVARAMRKFAKKRAAIGWDRLVDALETEFGVTLEKYRDFPKWLFRRHIVDAVGYRKVFRYARTRKLYLVNAYSHPSLVLGAKLAGVRVYELQHGFISEFHPAYSFPTEITRVLRGAGFPNSMRLGRRIQSAPHRLLVWGEYWRSAAQLPSNTKALVSGPTLAFAQGRERVLAMRAEASTPVSKLKRITFTSQGALATPLFQAAQHFARLLPTFQVTYRLHPNESLDDYSQMHSESPTNLKLSHREPVFLDLLAKTDYLVGGFSTTLYEGLAFGLRVIALRLPGYENLGAAIENGDITLLDPEPSKTELRAALAQVRPCLDANRYYAELADPSESRRFPGV